MPEHFDLLIVGAGLSGIGAAHHFQTRFPGKRYAILEARDAIGGTWDLFRYPGVRSDSDMFTLGYSFRPWREAKAIADGPSILQYVRDTARELGIDRHIRFNQKVMTASWSSSNARWSVETAAGGAGYTCDFLYVCSGYYRYDSGHTPVLPGRARFRGTVVHPQRWPADLDYSGKSVVVIGSGATAVTLVPAMASKAAKVTMLQRSPSYVLSLPATDPTADLARRVLPQGLAHRLIRLKNVLINIAFFALCRRAPRLAKWALRRALSKQLPAGFDVEKHFTPRYQPWDQRLCFVPDGDLLLALSSGRAAIETGTIRTLTEDGLELESGTMLKADVLVTATGLELLAIGGIALTVDEQPIAIGDTLTYKGTLLTGVPNFAYCVGYSNASWTLRADLSSKLVCRIIDEMQQGGYRSCRPVRPEGEPGGKPLLELTSGYVQRGVDHFPKQGLESPWHLPMNYLVDFFETQVGELHDGRLEFR